MCRAGQVICDTIEQDEWMLAGETYEISGCARRPRRLIMAGKAAFRTALGRLTLNHRSATTSRQRPDPAGRHRTGKDQPPTALSQVRGCFE